MTRRGFLAGAIASALTLAARKAFPAALAAAPDVGVATGNDYARAVTQAVDIVGGIRAFVKPGHVVVVKPNIGWNSPPEAKATTDPVVVRTLVSLCFAAGAARVWVFDRSVSNPRLAYVTSGIQRAAEEAGAKLLLVDDTEDRRLYVAQSIRDAAFLKETLVARLALECDSLVNCPIAKSHGEAGLTLALKNLMGVTGDNRGRWHWQLDDAIADINRLVRSTLTLVDASSIMLRGGPTGGSPANLRRMDTFIAGTNPVSTDAEAAKLFGMRASDLPYVLKAAEAGIGRAAGYTVRSAGTR